MPDEGTLTLKIISGGQAGVDRAALDFAIDNNLDHGGWCPAGRRAEDGVLDSRYLLTETEESDYSVRTRLNVRDSHGTLILAPEPLEGGTALTKSLALKMKKPVLVIDPADESELEKVNLWLQANNIRVLNIAGPRASKQPEIYEVSYLFLVKLYQYIQSVPTQ